MSWSLAFWIVMLLALLNMLAGAHPKTSKWAVSGLSLSPVLWALIALLGWKGPFGAMFTD